MIEPAAIAAALRAETQQSWAAVLGDMPRLTGFDGAQLSLRQERDRLHVSGGFGEAQRWRPQPAAHRFAITVAADATPERVAREIVRRLLPSYLPALATARAALARHQGAATAAEAALAYLLTAAGGGRRVQGAREIEGYLGTGAVHRIHVAPRDEGPAVLIELHRVDVETADEVVRLLAGRGHL